MSPETDSTCLWGAFIVFMAWVLGGAYLADTYRNYQNYILIGIAIPPMLIVGSFFGRPGVRIGRSLWIAVVITVVSFAMVLFGFVSGAKPAPGELLGRAVTNFIVIGGPCLMGELIGKVVRTRKE